MIAYATRIVDSVRGKTREDLGGDLDLADATLYRLAALGEAAKRISAALRERHPEIDWKGATGLRDRVIHNYDAVDWEIVMHTIEDDLPRLIDQLRALAPGEDR